MRRFSVRSSAVLRGGGLVLLGLAIWNAGNYGFFLVAGRTLGPKDYGLVAALLAATLVVSLPAQSLQYATARLSAAPPLGDASLAEGVYRRAWRRCIVATLAVTAVICLALGAARAIDPGFQIGPLLVTVLLIAPLGCFFLALGRLQGYHRFGAFALCFVLWGALRPVALVPLAALDPNVYAGLGASGIALAIALATAIWFTRTRSAERRPTATEWRQFSRPLLPVVIGLAGLGLLTNLDIIVGKITLDARSAGQFAAAAALAKAVFLIPQTVSSVLLPRSAARSAAAEDTGMLVGLGVGATLILGGLASLCIWAIASPLLRITYGSEFTVSANLLGAYAGAATLLGALVVAINHHIGRSSDRFVWAAGGLAVLQGLLFVAFHGGEGTIIAVDAAIAIVGLLLHECLFFRTGEAIVPGFIRSVRNLRHARQNVVETPETEGRTTV